MEIVECPIFVEYHTSDSTVSTSTGCGTVLSCQTRGLPSAQVPEPWNGNLAARVMFLSSNPSINLREQYPRGKPTLPDAMRFFPHRFSGIDPTLRQRWIDDSLSVLLGDGERACGAPHYWTEVRNATNDLFDEMIDPAEWDYRICISEVVHCKSTNNTGVVEAASICTGRYLQRFLNLAKATVVVVYGEARPCVWRFVAPDRPYDEHCIVIGPGLILGHLRMVLFLPAPGSAGIRRLSRALTGEQFGIARTLVAADDNTLRRLVNQLRPR
jgi:hypothetical protein